MRLILLVCALVLLAPTTPAFAEKVPWYEVEVVVFARAGAADGESWLDGREAPALEPGARYLGPTRLGSDLVPFQRLAPSALRLSKERGRLDAAKGMTPILHTGWVQPGWAREQSIPVVVNNETGSGTIHGTLRLILARYLHIETDLRFTPPGTNTNEAFPLYRLTESRRMRSKELHHLDHPQFGVIVLVTPIETR